MLHEISFIMCGYTYERGYWPGFKGDTVEISEALEMRAQLNCGSSDE